MLKRLLILSGIMIVLALVMFGVVILLQNYGNESPNPNEQVNREPQVSEQLPSQGVSVNANEESVLVPPKQVLSSEELEKVNAANFAKDFASRFASYSNQNFASNVEELLPDTTGGAQAYLLKLQKESKLGNEYVGVSSKAFIVTWVEWNPDTAGGRARLSLWRVETRGNDERGFGQDVELSIVKQGEGWMVSEIEWKDVK